MSSGLAGGLPQQKTECADRRTADGVGHMHRQIAGKLTGRVTKWIVLVFWILAVGVLGSFAGKLTEVQNNEASSWLPASSSTLNVRRRSTLTTESARERACACACA